MVTYKNYHAAILFAAGNHGHLLHERPGYRPVIEGPAASKNCITVGATYSNRPLASDGIKFDRGGTIHSFLEWASFSSSGPTREGRISPDVVAPAAVIVCARCRGMSAANLARSKESYGDAGHDDLLFSSGTSMSTPAVTGLLAVLRGILTRGEGSFTPTGALLKALVVHGAVDLLGSAMEIPSSGRASPRFVRMTRAPNGFQGFGLVNKSNSISPLRKRNQGTGGVIDSYRPSGEFEIQKFSIPGFAKKVVVTLAYSDYPGPRMLNVLDLTLVYGTMVAWPLAPTDPLDRQFSWTHPNVQKIVVEDDVPACDASIVLKISTNFGLARFAVVWEVFLV